MVILRVIEKLWDSFVEVRYVDGSLTWRETQPEFHLPGPSVRDLFRVQVTFCRPFRDLILG